MMKYVNKQLKKINNLVLKTYSKQKKHAVNGREETKIIVILMKLNSDMRRTIYFGRPAAFCSYYGELLRFSSHHQGARPSCGVTV